VLRTVLIANTTYLDQNEQSVARFITGLIDAFEFIRAQPKDAAGLVSDHLRQQSDGAVIYTEDEILAIWNGPGFSNVLWTGDGMLHDALAASRAAGQVERELRINDVLDRRFEPLLNEAQRRTNGKN
jgi:ABC-type nitrate/sulfonate/bicarbonate transport system substrate-binding protein